MILLLFSGFLLIEFLLALPILYLGVLTLAAYFAPRHSHPKNTTSQHTFAFLIPAHNEEALLPICLQSLKSLDYPKNLYSIHVVADNCTDQTAAVAQAAGAIVHVRQDTRQLGKPFALRFGLNDLWHSPHSDDAIIILDADTIASSNFLRVCDAHLERGERVIQSFYTARSPEHSWNESLRFAALAALHYLRPQARMVLGGSAGLKGNGMIFVSEILQRFPWSDSLTEDIEYHMTLLFAGERVTFAPDAVCWGEMPSSLKNAASQHQRWEQGRLLAAKTYVPRLLSAAWQQLRQGNAQRAFLLADAAAEHIIPPFSILVGFNGLLLIVSIGMWLLTLFTPQSAFATRAAQMAVLVSLITLFVQVSYVFSGLNMVHAPKKVYLAFLYAPALLFWKIQHYIRVLFGRKGNQPWVRTARNEEEV